MWEGLVCCVAGFGGLVGLGGPLLYIVCAGNKGWPWLVVALFGLACCERCSPTQPKPNQPARLTFMQTQPAQAKPDQPWPTASQPGPGKRKKPANPRKKSV